MAANDFRRACELHCAASTSDRSEQAACSSILELLEEDGPPSTPPLSQQLEGPLPLSLQNSKIFVQNGRASSGALLPAAADWPRSATPESSYQEGEEGDHGSEMFAYLTLSPAYGSPKKRKPLDATGRLSFSPPSRNATPSSLRISHLAEPDAEAAYEELRRRAR